MTYHLAGDSTVADPQPDELPLSGWGGFLSEHVDAPVRNHAFGGATTESFLAERWDGLIDGVRPFDTVLIQFGHNDQKQPELLGSRGGYLERLRAMVDAVHARGARSVLCTSPERRWFEGERITPTHGDYPNAVRDLADELVAPLIDLTAFTTWLYEDLGPADSVGLFCHFAPGEHPAWPEGKTDDTHFHERGARRIAAYVARSLRAIERADGDRPARGLEIVAREARP
ncbi:rhamnogalacturonan acetylesterase [Myceligenerans pegani]|uniref:Rhamnogalacturonan acetylesterase n=1 Tax=Myceligenerans pegani TaxID=2776917 RepID=A0ABR9N372_9MICO|nr:rhamnogalacturonan acetylesterase [Myceligenerans sp. TRM 65318]MBE1878101.1 rhamnogalacturonan acetylesterase [Myceligenerans sp. TRM 65318]MBE3020372.1 rhamnogalacturonan acetylesterase [Myceligenerans sp. TRM 65318]